MRDLIQTLTRGLSRQFVPPDSMSREEIALRVKQIIAENLGVRIEILTEETSFIDDLGAD